LGLPIEILRRTEIGVTGHSLKATGLSWAIKFGILEYDRAVLGRHASSTSSATATVKKFQNALLAVFNKTFRPDAPRSQYFAEETNTKSDAAQCPAEEAVIAKSELVGQG